MNSQVLITVPIERIVTVRHGDTIVEVRQPAAPRLQVLTFGYQGPVGTVAESVLEKAASAQAAAENATALAEDATTDLAALTSKLKDAFVYHAGAISAQEG